jgi:hypothetical protein
MPDPTGPWIAGLIRAEQDALITTTIARVRAAVPDYQALPDAALATIFAQVYTVFAQSLDTDDMAPWRAYFQAAFAARRQAGIPPAAIIATIALVQEQVLTLAERHLPPNDPARAAEARSRLRATAHRIRMYISELNLAHVTNRSPPDSALGSG